MTEALKNWSERNKEEEEGGIEQVKNPVESEGDGGDHNQITSKPAESFPSGSNEGSDDTDSLITARNPILEHQKKIFEEDRKRASVSRSPTPSINPNSGKREYLRYFMGVAFLFAVFAILWTWLGSGSETDANGNLTSSAQPGIGISWEEGQDQFKEYVKRMKEAYPSQTFETRTRIYSAVISTMTPEIPRQPSAIVLLTPPNIDSGFAPCLAQEIAKTVHSVFHNITGMQYTENIRKLDPGYFKNAGSITTIHDDLKTYLNNGKVVIVRDVQEVNREDHLMVFHAFCDNSAAPDKRATFIFIVPVSMKIYMKYEWEDQIGAEISQEILNSAWDALTPDKRPALIARVAANIVMVQPGDRCADQ